jgi:hypothetical protein
MREALDLTGRRFGRLTVIHRVYSSYAARPTWFCQCDCGNSKIVRGANLKTGSVASCGCLVKERIISMNTTHGLSHVPEYNVWTGMIKRCHVPSNKDYPRYGGRGITVCDRWKESFEDFYLDMGPRPSAEHSIEREDNSKGYGPGNCKWATPVEQTRNRSITKWVEHNGRKITISQLAEETGVPLRRLRARIFTYGMDVETAVSRPLSGPGLIEYEGESRNLHQWADHLGIRYQTLVGRCKAGWSVEDMLTTPTKPSDSHQFKETQ